MLRNAAYQSVVVDLLCQPGELRIVEKIFNSPHEISSPLVNERGDPLIKGRAYEAQEQVDENDTDCHFQYI